MSILNFFHFSTGSIVKRTNLSQMTKKFALSLGSVGSILSFCFVVDAKASEASLAPASTSVALANGQRLVIDAMNQQSVAQSAKVIDAHGNVVIQTQLLSPRNHHTITVLPNGATLVYGGLDHKNELVQRPEIFDSGTNRFRIAEGEWPIARAGHTVTLLTDGKLLITGGWHPKLGALYETELFDPITRKVELLSTELQPPRYGHTATLLADGRVLILGGYGESGVLSASGTLFDHNQIRFLDVEVNDAVSSLKLHDLAPPVVAASIPEAESTDFPVGGLIALRFSKSMDTNSIDARTITLVGPNGVAATTVVAAENGRLAFVTVPGNLLPSVSYQLYVNGVRDFSNQPLPFFSMRFSTLATTPTRDASERAAAYPVKPGSATVAGVRESALLALNTSNASASVANDDSSALRDVTQAQFGNKSELKAIDIGQNCPTQPDSPYPLLTPRGDSTDINDTDDPDKCEDECDTAVGGDPVDLRTGMFVFERTDVKIRDLMPIRLTRVYRVGSVQLGSSAARSFGGVVSHQYNMYLTTFDNQVTLKQDFKLHRPDGADIFFRRLTANGGTAVTAEHKESATDFYGALLKREGSDSDYVITKKNGEKYIFAINGTLKRMEDRYGNYVQVIRPTLTAPDDRAWNVSRVVTSSGRYIDFTYNANNAITQIKDHTGRTWKYAYDVQKLTSVTYPDGLVESYTYDASDRMISVKNRRGTVLLTNEYGTDGRVVKQTLANGGVFRFTYTGPANAHTQVDVADPRGNVRRVTFNSKGFMSSETFAAGTPIAQIYTYERDTSGLRAAVVDPLSRRTEYTRDSMGNVTRTRNLVGTPDAYNTSASYTAAFNQIASSTDPRGQVATFTYDTNGSLTQITDPLGNKQRFTNNGTGQPLTAIDGVGNTKTFTYRAGMLESAADALGRTTAFAFDGLGRTISIGDPLNRRVLMQYDTMSRLVKLTDPLNQVSTMTYNSNGKRLTFTDPKNQTTAWTYDTSERVTGRKDALLQNEAFTYNANDRLVSSTDRKGQVTTREYDALDRLTQITYQGGATTKYTYDAGDRITKIEDSVSGVITRTYDTRDRLTSETTPQGTVSYTYDLASRRTGMTVTGQPAVTYTYDNANRLTSVTQNTKSTSYTYDAANRLTKVTLGNGVTKNMAYDAASQLSSITYKKADDVTVIGDLIYAYDAAGQLTKLTGSLANVSLPAATTGAAVYDANNRLTSWNGQSIAYDSQGNMTSASGRTYTWDARSRLTAIAGSATASFQYDPLGRRTVKTTPGTSNVATSLTYDGSNPVLEKQGTTVTGTNVTGLGIDSYMARTDTQGSTTAETWPLTDHLGSVIALTEATGTIVTSYNYEPYGNTTVAGTASKNPHQYTGRENDSTGLYYYRARYYDPKLMRFIAEDPIGLAGGINSYGYVGRNPIIYRDPDGLIRIPDIPGADGETSVHANPGPEATSFRPDHGSDHIHLGKNDGPRVRTSDFEPVSKEDAKKMTRQQKEFCQSLSDESKEKIRKAQRAIFKHGRAMASVMATGGGLSSIAAACRNDPVWCAEQIGQSGGFP
jgi:RHS repeat-associated protein